MSSTVVGWERRRGGPAPALLLAVVGLAALIAMGVGPVQRAVEADLAARAVAALEAVGIDGVDVTVRGRDVVLSGSGLDAATADEARAAVDDLPGVRSVTVVEPPGGLPVAAASEEAQASPTPADRPTPTPATPSPSPTPTATASPTPTPAPTDDNPPPPPGARRYVVRFATLRTELTPERDEVVEAEPE
ncbi:MAG: hypothetical protein KY434_09520, partial [Actinobacteria bacterium]|nr:hypothetical protein [Actinomycetota bacterium]